jgi:hypothetical protein
MAVRAARLILDRMVGMYRQEVCFKGNMLVDLNIFEH